MTEEVGRVSWASASSNARILRDLGPSASDAAMSPEAPPERADGGTSTWTRRSATGA
jgi:hypothetical protein